MYDMQLNIQTKDISTFQHCLIFPKANKFLTLLHFD